MTPRPSFICVMVNDMARSLTFYGHLGFKFPPEAYGEIHVELELPGGLQIFWLNVCRSSPSCMRRTIGRRPMAW